MLTDIYHNEISGKLDLNCAETVLYAANEAYDMGLSPKVMKMSSAFGGGMGIENTCGALTASIMVLGYLFVDRMAHESELIKQITSEFLETYETRMGSIDCGTLKKYHRTESEGCKVVISSALELLDQTVSRYSSRRVR